MNLEQLTISLPLAKRLYEKGVTKESVFYYSKIQRPDWEVVPKEKLMAVVDIEQGAWTFLEEGLHRGDVLPAYTLQELLEVMPDDACDCMHELRVGKEYAGYQNEEYNCGPHEVGDNPLLALEALATYLLDNDLFTPTS
jgi:hypothetical protein